MIKWGFEYIKSIRSYEPYKPIVPKEDKGIRRRPKGDGPIQQKKVCPICHQYQGLNGSCSCDPLEKFEALVALQKKLLAK